MVNLELFHAAACAGVDRFAQGDRWNSAAAPVAFVAKAPINHLPGDRHLSHSQHRGGYLCVSVSVALLLARLGSVTPIGGITVTVSESVPVADGLIVPVAM